MGAASARAIRSGLDRLVSFDTFASDSGRPIDTGELEIVHLAPGDDKHCEVFEGADSSGATGFTRVSRTKLIDGRVVAWIVDYVPDEVLSTDEIRQSFKGSVLDVLLDLDSAAYSDCTIIPVIADPEMADRFGCAHVPLLQISELTRAESGRIINRSEAWLAPMRSPFNCGAAARTDISPLRQQRREDGAVTLDTGAQFGQ